MSPETLFKIFNTAVLPGWVILLFTPRWRIGVEWIAGMILPAVLAIGYLVLFVTQIGHIEGGFQTLAGVRQLFSNEYVLLAGWVHYLAFDLFIGSWEVQNAQQNGISHWFIVPCLLLTFFSGPIGLLLYLVLCTVRIARQKP
ncbi:ABA4-like family protein [Thalassoroseus pseudoceratinae]|uniref:ABA4-like family protein n=1 Tax=Thalassoroseus pseudoceratinae TaxID=2713176 RepID=UPI00142280FE|nr:ABA4-like family protein [Thalassoroseus pseudoceratinae]